MQQSSHRLAGLPACLILAALAVLPPPRPVVGQVTYRVLQRENFRRDPGPTAGLLASVNAGTVMVAGDTLSGWVQVTLEGWVWAQSLRELSDPQFDYAVNVSGGENLRAEPDGTILARMINGFWLRGIEQRGAWVRVTRTGWMWGRSLEMVQGDDRVGPSADATPPAVPTEAAPARPAPTSRPPPANGDAPQLARAVTVGRSVLRGVPDGDTTATLSPEASLRILSRSGEWVRVQTEGWVHESDLRPVSGDVLVGVSGAEVRARPGDFEGRTLQWTVQLIAVRTSDGLRRELPAGRRYIHARGPMPETGFVYILLSDDQVVEVERLSPLAQIVVLVRVRVGRDEYLGNPVVDLVEMSVRTP